MLAFESADHPVDAWMARAVELMADYGGRRHADEAAGLRWRTAFIRMPYARELTVPMGIINDTFETAITWERFEPFHEAVRKATEDALVEATGAREASRRASRTSIRTGRPSITPSTCAAIPVALSSNGGISRPAPPTR